MIEVDDTTRQNGRLSAAAMAYAVAVDPQFSMPVRPCLAPGLVCVPLDDGLAFAGTANRQTVLRGRAALTLIPRLLPALDGAHTMDELAAAHPDVTATALRACISLLYVSGLLQDGPDGLGSGLIPAEVADYLGRNLDTTRINHSRGEACDRLARTRVLIAGPEPLAGRLRAELAGAGVDAHGWTGPGQTVGDGDLLVAVDDGDTAAMAAVDQACRRSGISWLRTAAGERTAEIGPLFNARYTGCHECFAGHRPHPDGTPSPARAAIWAALTATEIVHLLSRVGSTPSTSGCTVFDLGDWTQSMVGAYRRPGCPQCLPARAPAPTASAHLYEQAVAAPPREWLNLKDHQAHYRPANLSLQRYNKEYLAAPRIPLDGEPPATGPRLTLGTLAVLLRRTAGLREDEPATASGKVNRWAPTGGNLGSVQAYLLALDVPGLPPGCYFYQRGDHSLARIRAGAPETDAAAVCPQLAAQRPAALIALTGALGVVAAKYQDFAYRILCLDAGVALAQLTALADDHRVTIRIADRWDDTAVSRALRIEPADEPVTTVLALDPRNHDDLHH